MALSQSATQISVEDGFGLFAHFFGNFPSHLTGTFTRVIVGSESSIGNSGFLDLDISGISFSDNFSAFVSGGVGPIVSILLAGNDTFFGTAGADGFIGYGGNDTVSYARASAGIIADLDAGGLSGEAAGDTFNSIENLTGSKFADVLSGNAGNNVLDGGGGADTMHGRGGNDTYVVNHAGDVVVEAANGGTDTVRSSISYTLPANVERLVLTGSADINGTGNALANTLTGNAGKNVLNGKGGADRMEGKAGNDTYVVDNKGDVVVEAANGGTDTVKSSISYTLTANVERLALTGSADISGTGNALANVITGNAGKNKLNGGSGNDTLNGGNGNDTLNGGNGNDKLNGGAGKDTLNGGAGKDILTGGGGIDFFRFNTALGASNVDTITDFKVNVDKIQLEDTIFAAIGPSLTANEFVANATGAATNGAQHILYNTANGRLYYDADGNGGQARVHFATLKAGLALDHLDFLVI